MTRLWKRAGSLALLVVLWASGAGAQSVVVTADKVRTNAGNLTLAPAGDLVLDPAGDDIYPATGYKNRLGLINRKLLEIHGAELWIETLVAQNTIATIGGRILVGPTTTLTRDLAALTTSQNGSVAAWAFFNQTAPAVRTNGSLHQITTVITTKPAGNVYLYVHAPGVDTLLATYSTAGTYTVSHTMNGAHQYYFHQSSQAGTVVATLTAADGHAYVKHNSATVGDTCYLEANGHVEHVVLTGGPYGVAPDYYYAVTRDADGTGANTWYAGEALFNTGQVGSGLIDIYSVRGVNGGGYGPAIAGMVRTGTAYNALAPRWVIGDLNGTYGIGTTRYGVAFGDPSKAWMTLNDTDGLVMRYGATKTMEITPAGGASFTGSVTVTGGNAATTDLANVTGAVGGGNLIPANSGFEYADLTGWTIYDAGTERTSAGTSTTTPIEGANCYQISWAAATNVKGVYTSTVNENVWKAGQTYVVSWWARTASPPSTPSAMSVTWTTAPATSVTVLNPVLSTTWQRYARRFVWGATVDSRLRIFMAAYPQTANTLFIDAIQISEGNAVTGYAAAPQDIVPASVTGAKIAGTTITSNHIATGAVIAEKIAAGAISADKIAVGYGRNWIANSEFRRGRTDAQDPSTSWSAQWGNDGLTWTNGHGLASWTLAGSGTAYVTAAGLMPAGTGRDIQGGRYPAAPGQRFEFSAHIGNHRATSVKACMAFYSAALALLTEGCATTGVGPDKAGGTTLAGYGRTFAFATAPATTAWVRPFIRIFGPSTDPAEPSVYVFYTRLFLGLATSDQTAASEWSPGGVTTITGDTLATDLVISNTLRSSAATSRTVGTGIWIDASTGTPTFRVGNPGGNRIDYDGSSVVIYADLYGDDWTLTSANGLYFDGNGDEGTSSQLIRWGSYGSVGGNSNRTWMRGPDGRMSWKVFADQIEAQYDGASKVGITNGGNLYLYTGNIVLEAAATTTSGGYPMILGPSDVLTAKTNGADGSHCSGGVDWITTQYGIVTGVGCLSPGMRPAALQIELADLRAEIETLKSLFRSGGQQ